MIKYTPIKCEDCTMTYIYRGFILHQNEVTDVNLPGLWTAQRIMGSTGKTSGTCYTEHLAITVLGKIDDFWERYTLVREFAQGEINQLNERFNRGEHILQRSE